AIAMPKEMSTTNESTALTPPRELTDLFGEEPQRGAVRTAGSRTASRVRFHWVEAEALEQDGGEHLLDGADGILVPGGFGIRGTRGMMRAARVARERGIPFFGICYGFQWAVVEFARNVLRPRQAPTPPSATSRRRTR
ncbi:MAG: hypothetical protein MZU95_03215, partial [Desulfomicrobium escambiense]|nr:hypothetical protein [Desulfomicrobium escambiense]